MLQDEQQALKTVASKLDSALPRSSTEDVESAVQAAYQLIGRATDPRVRTRAGRTPRRRATEAQALNDGGSATVGSGQGRGAFLGEQQGGARAAVTISCDDDQLR